MLNGRVVARVRVVTHLRCTKSHGIGLTEYRFVHCGYPDLDIYITVRAFRMLGRANGAHRPRV